MMIVILLPYCTNVEISRTAFAFAEVRGLHDNAISVASF